VAAPLWADRYHLQPEVLYVIPYTIEETQTLHQQGFASLMPACTALNEECGVIYFCEGDSHSHALFR
jgi:hypothetical protein